MVTLLRLVGAVLALAAFSVPMIASGGDSSGISDQLSLAFSDFPEWALDIATATLQISTLAAPLIGLLGLTALRRWRRLGYAVATFVIAGTVAVLVSTLAGNEVFGLRPDGPARYGLGAAFPSNTSIIMITALILVDLPWWPHRWRRYGWAVVTTATLARFGATLAEPATILVAVTSGIVAARLAQLAVGIPNTRPNPTSVGDRLAEFGYSFCTVTAGTALPGFTSFRATTKDGRLLYVKVISRETWATFLPVRIYRTLRFREVGDDRPFAHLRNKVEHEALCALKARSDGVSTVRLAVVTDLPPDAMLMAFDARPLRPISSLQPDERPADLLVKVWSIVTQLRRSHTVHHRLNGDYLLVDADGEVVVVDFAAAELGASARAMAADVAEVLAATGSRIGVEQAVAAAVHAVGPDVVASALPRLQPLALTRPTRAILKQTGSLESLRAEVQRVTGAPDVPIEALERIKPRTVITVLLAAAAVAAVVPQLVGAGDAWGLVADANWGWAAMAVVLSAFTYVGAALALDGSLPDRLPFGPNLGVQVATSFVGVAAPGGALAVTARFLQKRGVDPAVSVAAVSIDTVAGVLVHITLLGAFVGFAGSTGLSGFALPSTMTIGLVTLAVAVLVGLAVAVPSSRAIMVSRFVPAVRRSFHGLAETARQPAKMLELFGGSALVTLGYILALVVSVSAFGTGPSFTSIALVYLVGSVVSSVAPTPGGIGAVEATLIAGLTAAGMTGEAAVAAVFLFRLATFWLPLLPGWLAFTSLERSGNL